MNKWTKCICFTIQLQKEYNTINKTFVCTDVTLFYIQYKHLKR